MDSHQDRSQQPSPSIGVARPPSAADVSNEVVFDISGLDVYYGKSRSTATRSRR
jgi:hypothetical protein